MSDDVGRPDSSSAPASPTGFTSPTGFACLDGGFRIPWARPIFPSATPAATTLPLPRPVPWPAPMSRLRAAADLGILALLILIGYLAVGYASAMLPTQDERLVALVGTLAIGLLAILVCAGLVKMHRQPMSSIGWRADRGAWDAAIGLFALAGIYALGMMLAMTLTIVYPELLGQPSEAQQAIEESFPRLSWTWLLPTTLIVALWEEVVFRGFLLTRLQAILRRWWLTVPLGTAIFALPHFYEGSLAMVMVAFIGLVMSLLFVWRRSLVPAVMLHWAHNTIMFMMIGALSPSWQ